MRVRIYDTPNGLIRDFSEFFFYVLRGFGRLCSINDD